MRGVLFPLLVGFSTFYTNKLPTISTETSCNVDFITFLTLCFLRFLELLQGITNLKEVVGMKSCLETRNTTWGEEYDLTAAGASQGWLLVFTNHTLLKTFFAKHMKALEQSGIFVGFMAVSTGKLDLYLLEELMGYMPLWLDILIWIWNVQKKLSVLKLSPILMNSYIFYH